MERGSSEVERKMRVPAIKLLLGLLAVGCLTAGKAAASGLLPPREHNRLFRQVDQRPMVFFVAKGPENACGPGCNEWIAALGTFNEGTAERFRAFMGKLDRNLPIF